MTLEGLLPITLDSLANFLKLKIKDFEVETVMLKRNECSMHRIDLIYGKIDGLRMVLSLIENNK